MTTERPPEGAAHVWGSEGRGVATGGNIGGRVLTAHERMTVAIWGMKLTPPDAGRIAATLLAADPSIAAALDHKCDAPKLREALLDYLRHDGSGLNEGARIKGHYDAGRMIAARERLYDLLLAECKP